MAAAQDAEAEADADADADADAEADAEAAEAAEKERGNTVQQLDALAPCIRSSCAARSLPRSLLSTLRASPDFSALEGDAPRLCLRRCHGLRRLFLQSREAEAWTFAIACREEASRALVLLVLKKKKKKKKERRKKKEEEEEEEERKKEERRRRRRRRRRIV
jgi:hypothetical protein